jgi:uncharacterized protein YdaU (DUF1376 family)
MTNERKPHPYVRIWVSDIVQSCQDMSTAQFGAHVRMLLHAWDRGYCPSDMTRLMRIVGDIGKPALEEVLERWVLSEVEGVAGKVYMNRRLEQERQVMIDQAASRSAAAQKANAIRWGSQTDPIRIANGSQTDPTLDTILHTPDTNTPDSRDQTLHSHSSDMRSAQSKRRRRPDDPLSWNVDEGWVGITDADRADWAEAFPAVDIDAKLKGLTLWLKANPKKAKKSRWRAWLLGRLRDEQDRGGSRAAGGGGGGFHRDKSHIPEDSHPDEEHLWFMTDGRTPRRIAIYKTKDGRLRYTSGEYAEDTTSQGDGNENDE